MEAPLFVKRIKDRVENTIRVRRLGLDYYLKTHPGIDTDYKRDIITEAWIERETYASDIKLDTDKSNQVIDEGFYILENILEVTRRGINVDINLVTPENYLSQYFYNYVNETLLNIENVRNSRRSPFRTSIRVISAEELRLEREKSSID